MGEEVALHQERQGPSGWKTQPNGSSGSDRSVWTGAVALAPSPSGVRAMDAGWIAHAHWAAVHRESETCGPWKLLEESPPDRF